MRIFMTTMTLRRPSRQVGKMASQLQQCKRSYSALLQLPPVLPRPPSPDSPGNNDGLWSNLMDRYSPIRQRERVQRAEMFFSAATHQANDPRWYGPGRISRDFRARHAVLTLHIWLLHKRLLHDTQNKERALLIQEELFNILWEDTLCRIRAQGVGALMENRHLLQVQQYTFLHLTHYDHVYTTFLDKPEERLQELRAVMWQHVLVRDADSEHRHDHLQRLAWYVEANYQNIMLHWPDEYYQQGRVAWVDLPDFSQLQDADGTVLPDQDVHPDDVVPAPWLTNITLRGQYYYWNTETNQVSWTKPLV